MTQYERRRSQGQCAKCGEPSVEATCEACRIKLRARRKLMKAQGKCRRCGGGTLPGAALCVRCRDQYKGFRMTVRRT